MCYVYLCLIGISSHQMVSILQTVSLICDTASVFVLHTLEVKKTTSEIESKF